MRKRNQPVSPIPNSNNKQSDFQSTIADIKSGKLDAKQQSFKMLENLTPQQKVAIRQLLPQVKKLGKAFGVSDENIENFIKELQSKL